MFTKILSLTLSASVAAQNPLKDAHESTCINPDHEELMMQSKLDAFNWMSDLSYEERLWFDCYSFCRDNSVETSDGVVGCWGQQPFTVFYPKTADGLVSLPVDYDDKKHQGCCYGDEVVDYTSDVYDFADGSYFVNAWGRYKRCTPIPDSTGHEPILPHGVRRRRHWE